ncbi:IspD/TarI family cytidylyltransferase [Pseudonocardia sp. CA-107938]|uniref:IspD/TarI family cytidylyltransferase n=1 Tax=Pseudonocardia sp. CA-107938 TaxID=3240021 RepID=UPI003D8D301C
MNVAAVVVCDAPDLDVLTPVGGVPLLVRAVDMFRDAGEFSRVHVLAAPEEHARLSDACAGRPIVVHPHITQRPNRPASNGSGTLRRTIGAVDALVVHDVTWALVGPYVLPAVLAGLAAGHDAVVPVVPLTDTVKDVTASGLVAGTPDRAGLRVVQTPQAYRSAVLDELAGPRWPALVASGVEVHTVAGDPAALPLRTAADVELATAVLRGEQA